jgi:dTMP kinase
MFLCIEGIDGAGKTTQLKLLAERLAPLNPCVLIDPGTTPIGQELRKLVKDAQYTMPAICRAMLFTAARASLTPVIEEALAANRPVLCDRWLWSTLVYQSQEGVPQDAIVQLSQLSGTLLPDAFIFLDVESTDAVARITTGRPNLGKCAAPSDRYDMQNLTQIDQRRSLYLDTRPGNVMPATSVLAEWKAWNDIHVIWADATYSPRVLHDDVWQAVCEFWPALADIPHGRDTLLTT